MNTIQIIEGMNPLQWHRALALAMAHGHDWSFPTWRVEDDGPGEPCFSHGADPVCVAHDDCRASRDIARDCAASGAAPSVEHTTMVMCERDRPTRAVRGWGHVPASWEDAVSEWKRSEQQGPFAGRRPSPSHTTGSGRLSWLVDPDGTTTLTVERPRLDRPAWPEPGCTSGYHVLRAVIDPDGRVEVERLTNDYCVRHVEAIACLLEVADTDQARERLAYLLEGALPDWQPPARDWDADYEWMADVARAGRGSQLPARGIQRR